MIMDFKIDGKFLCIDLSSENDEEIIVVINEIISVCEHLEESGYLVDVTEYVKS